MGTRTLTVLALATMEAAVAQRVGAPTDDLTNLSVDELFRIEVTSVGRKAQQLSKAPAAVFVLTAEDIRRSGATSIPEALQWVPGLTVLRIDGRSWTISARGSASLYSDKMLVMIDGRSLYTPLFSGVVWDSIDVPLEDIEQIEVVRGPGAVMWGPNAVNGVINIITKSAHATKGGEFSAAGGNELRGSILARWGAEPSEHFAFRVWAKLDDRNPAFSSPGFYSFGAGNIVKDPRAIRDLDSETARLGFRIDAEPSGKDRLLFTGDVYKTGRQDDVAYPVLLPLLIDPVHTHTGYEGGFIQARWTRTVSPGNESDLQFTFDKNQLDFPFIGVNLNNLTLNYEKRLQTGERNEVYWGGGFQQYWDDTHSQRFFAFNPTASVYRVGDVVARDEYQLWADRLLLSVGVRIDYSSYGRFEFQPSFRLLYTPNRRQSAWIALSRAARIPSRFERDSEIDSGQRMLGTLPVHVGEFGSTAIRSENERSVEAGYRIQSAQRWSVDAALFWSYYGNLRALEIPQQPDVTFIGRVPSFSMALTESNAGKGRSYGGELSGTWQVTPAWRLIPSYTYLNETTWLPAFPRYSFDFASSGSRHRGLIRSQHDLSRKLQFDLMARARSRNVAFNLPGVLLADARLGWRASRDTEFSFSIQNLAGRTVLETYSEAPFVAIPLRRTFVFKWTQRF